MGGDGLFVVGLDIRPGVYRTSGPRRGSSGHCSLLSLTSTRDVIDFARVAGPVTITVGPGVKAVQVAGRQPWELLADDLDSRDRP
jgi:hypothetical protein